jgi:hypothetical protein
LYGKFYNKRPVATGLDRFFLRCGPIRTGPKRSGYGPLISGSVYTGCGCQLPRFEVKNRTRLDFKTLVIVWCCRCAVLSLRAIFVVPLHRRTPLPLLSIVKEKKMRNDDSISSFLIWLPCRRRWRRGTWF